MAKGRGWLIFLIIFAVVMFFGMVFIIGLMSAFQNKPAVRAGTVLQFDLSGMITEHFPREPLSREFEGAHLQLHDIRKALAMAEVDDRIKGVYLRVGTPGIGWAKAQEIQGLLRRFRESGKFVVAFMETCDEKAYYVALAADEVYLQPHAYTALNGFASEVPFIKRMFNKLGMKPEVENIGKYKSAGDILKRESMSPAHREETQAILDEVYETFLSGVTEARKIDRQALVSALARGLYRAEDLLDLKLVDGLKYETEVTRLLKEKAYGAEATDSGTRKLRTISVSQYARIPAKEVGLGKGSKIALIYAVGNIVPGESGYDPLMGRNMGSQSIMRMLRSARENSLVKAIVLRIDSGGGSALASDQMLAEIQKTRETKPVIISMSDLAASGGYWMALAGDAIVAQPLTLTGSIGVVSALFDMSETYDKLGIDWETVKTSAHADMPTEKRPLTPEEWAQFKKLTRDIYDVFVQKVADNRGKSFAEIDKIAQGRVWTGNQALHYGLVDSLGGLEAALAKAKQKAGLAPDAETSWLVYPQPKGFFETLMEKLSVQAARTLARTRQEWAAINALPPELKQALKRFAVLAHVRRGEILAIPAVLPEIR